MNNQILYVASKPVTDSKSSNIEVFQPQNSMIFCGDLTAGVHAMIVEIALCAGCHWQEENGCFEFAFQQFSRKNLDAEMFESFFDFRKEDPDIGILQDPRTEMSRGRICRDQR